MSWAFHVKSCRGNKTLLGTLFLNSHLRICLLILEREEGRGSERERDIYVRNINRLPLALPLTGNQTRNLGMCPDRGSKPQPFGVLDNTEPPEPPSQGWQLFAYQSSGRAPRALNAVWRPGLKGLHSPVTSTFQPAVSLVCKIRLRRTLVKIKWNFICETTDFKL